PRAGAAAAVGPARRRPAARQHGAHVADLLLRREDPRLVRGARRAGLVPDARAADDRRGALHARRLRAVRRARPDRAAGAARRQPLTAPLSPPTIRRSAAMKKRSAGTIESAVKARMLAAS